MNKKLLNLMLLALVSSTVLAQSQSAPPDLSQYLGAATGDDWSVKFWQSLLGDFAIAPFSQVGAPSTLIGKLFIVFNGAIFAVGTAWLSYGILSGIVGTAQDGQALGQRINTAWYPIRVITGLAGMMPVLGGFTLMQGALMMTAALGIGTANFMLKTAVEDGQLTQLVGTASLTGAPAVSRGEIELVATNMLRANVCLIGYARVVTEWKTSPGTRETPVPPQYIVEASPEATPDGMKIRYGSKPEPEVCGSVSIRMERSRSASSATGFRVASVDYAGIRNAVSVGAAQRLLAADRTVAAAAADYMAAMDGWMGAGSTDQFKWDPVAVDKTALAVRADIQSLVSSVIAEKGSSFTESAKQNMLRLGWAGLGAWYSAFAESNAALADAVSGIKLTAAAPQATLYSEVEVEMVRLNGAIARAEAAADQTGTGAEPGVVQAVMKETCAGGESITATATDNCSLGQAVVNVLLGVTSKGSGGGELISPVIASKNLGDFVMTLGSTLTSMNFTWVAQKAAMAAKWAGNAVAAVGSATGIVGVAGAGAAASAVAGGAETLMAHAVPLGWTFLVLGGFLSIYLPLLPFIVWVGSLLTYAASFIEGLIAMPLHSLAHLHTDGEGMGQATSRGYLFFLNTLVRPPIMVLSFFVASAMVIGLGTLTTQLFAPAMASAQGNSITGIASIIGYLVVYFLLMTTLIQGCFELINVIPDQVIGFVGAGDVRSSLGHGTESKINSLFVNAGRSGTLAGQASAAGGAALDKSRQNKGGV